MINLSLRKILRVVVSKLSLVLEICNLFKTVMETKSKRIRVLRICLILILSFSIFPEFVFSFEDTNYKVEIDSASPEGTNSCNEHHCPILPNKPYQHCAVCCALSHFYIENLSAGIAFHLNKLQPCQLIETAFYGELFPKGIFHPPQSIL